MLESRKFKLMLYDAVLSVVAHFAAAYLAPEYLEHVQFLITTLQIPVGILIGAIALEDFGVKSNPSNPAS